MQFISGTVNGCFDTSYHSITINPTPFIKASGSAALCLGNSTQLSVTGSSSYQWSPNEGLSCTTCTNPIAKPKVTTPYVVSTTNNYGCTSSDTVIITVISPMKIEKSNDIAICIGQSTNLLVSGGTNYLWSPETGLNNATISNPTASPTVTTRYRIVGYDGFNCFTDSAFILVEVGKYPTVNLGPDLTLSSGTLHPMNSVIENGPITKWLWTPSLDLNCNTCSLPIATIKKDITYKVEASSRYGCKSSDTINIKVFCLNSQVFIPNAFSPDGDGLNDILTVRATGIVTVKYFRIFNRWGELVFEKNNFPPNNPGYGWDGKTRGIAGSSSVYVYIAEVVCENGDTYIYKGNTSIIK